MILNSPYTFFSGRPATVDADDPWRKVEREDEYNDLLEHKKRYLKGMSGNPADYTHR